MLSRSRIATRPVASSLLQSPTAQRSSVSSTTYSPFFCSRQQSRTITTSAATTTASLVLPPALLCQCRGAQSSSISNQNNAEAMSRLYDALPVKFMKWSDFDALCHAHGVIDAKAASDALVRCGAIVTSDDGIHGHAAQAVRDMGAAMGQPWEPHRDQQLRVLHLKQEVVKLRPAYEKQLAQCVNARRRTWSGFFAFTGVQLAVFSRLTYFDLDWDTMEPISYFLGSGIGVLAFGYTLLRGIDFTNSVVDKAVIEKKYISHPDVVKYYEAVEELESLEAKMDDKNAWIRTRGIRSS